MYKIEISEPDTIIWIAEDVAIHCKAKHIKWWQRKIIQWLLGWKYKEAR